MLFSAADLPTCEVSTKRNKVGEEEINEEQSKQEPVWRECPKTLPPDISAAALLPDDGICPERCYSLKSSEDLDPSIVNKLK